MNSNPLLGLESDAVLKLPTRELWSVSASHVHDYHLGLLRKRFETLPSKIATLGKLVELQGVREITTLDDIVPLLFQHTIYKSYPISLLEKRRFDALTRWLGELTTHDLSRVDASKCESIDEWLELLESTTPLAVNHSTGTTGKLSFVPRDQTEADWFITASFKSFEGFGDEPDLISDLLQSGERIPILYPSYRYGRHIAQRMLEGFVRKVGKPGACFALFDELLSADVSSLAGRVKAAEERGELDQLEVAPALLAKFKATTDRRATTETSFKQFFQFMLDNCRGQRVMSAAVVPYLWSWTQAAEEQGLHHLFAPNSIFTSGGGWKGTTAPPDWRARIERFLGAPLQMGYGMSETMGGMSMCPYGHYHPYPYAIPFVLDPESGAPLPRTGTQTGRYAVFDLLVSSYWGGLISGDCVTMVWDEQCPCGRTGPYLLDSIERFVDKTGADDKISCAGAADAHERAMSYLIERATAG